MAGRSTYKEIRTNLQDVTSLKLEFMRIWSFSFLSPHFTAFRMTEKQRKAAAKDMDPERMTWGCISSSPVCHLSSHFP
jgi:hypothetical protein